MQHIADLSTTSSLRGPGSHFWNWRHVKTITFGRYAFDGCSSSRTVQSCLVVIFSCQHLNWWCQTQTADFTLCWVLLEKHLWGNYSSQLSGRISEKIILVQCRSWCRQTFPKNSSPQYGLVMIFWAENKVDCLLRIKRCWLFLHVLCLHSVAVMTVSVTRQSSATAKFSWLCQLQSQRSPCQKLWLTVHDLLAISRHQNYSQNLFSSIQDIL